MISARWTQATIAGLLLMGGLSACDSGPTIPPGFFQALIYGTVVTPAGDAVQEARLTIRPFRDQCDGRRVGRIVVLSSEAGRYEKEITADTPEPLSCLKIEVEAPPESDLGDTTFTVAPVELELREEPPFDSLARGCDAARTLRESALDGDFTLERGAVRVGDGEARG